MEQWKYSPCVERLKNDLVEYINNPTTKNLERVHRNVPAYLVDKYLFIEGDELEDLKDKKGSNAPERYEDLQYEYKRLGRELKDLVESNPQCEVSHSDIYDVIEKVLHPSNENYTTALQVIRQQGKHFGK